MVELTGQIGGSGMGGGMGGALIPGPAGHTPTITITSVVTGSPAAVSASTTEEGDVGLAFTLPPGSSGWPILTAAHYHRPVGLLSDGSSLTATANRILLMRFAIATGCTLGKIRTHSLSNGVLAGKSIKFLVYSAGENGWPATKLYQSGAVSLLSASAVYQASSVGLAISPGSLWVGYVCDSTLGLGSNLASFGSRNGNVVTDDPTDTSNGCWDAVGYDGSSYASPLSSALDATLTRIRMQGALAPAVYLSLS